ncbi:hypothetical protein FRB97_009219, partial [Tulasnella sp. 331]
MLYDYMKLIKPEHLLCVATYHGTIPPDYAALRAYGTIMSDSENQTPTSATALRIIIIGCGIAGPALACMLRKQGYEPVIYEKIKAQTAASGASPSLMPQINGLNVINIISPRLIEGLTATPAIAGKPIAQALFKSQLSGEVLLQSDALSQYLKTLSIDGQTTLSLQIGKELTMIQQDESSTSVTATFADSTLANRSLLIGCDGVHSATRAALFGKEPATYTDLMHTAGSSLTHPSLASPNNPATFVNVFGDGAHVVAYPISNTHTSWAITTREAESRETWRAMGEEQQDAFCRDALYKDWRNSVNELVEVPERVIKHRVYDGPELAKWHQSGVVLLGDAAHPASPVNTRFTNCLRATILPHHSFYYLGQGTNQAFEDIYHFDHILAGYIPPPAMTPASTALLDIIFTEYETLRIARTSSMAKAARAQGDMRVLLGEEA